MADELAAAVDLDGLQGDGKALTTGDDEAADGADGVDSKSPREPP